MLRPGSVIFMDREVKQKENVAGRICFKATYSDRKEWRLFVEASISIAK